MTGKQLAKTLTEAGIKVNKSHERTAGTDAGVDLPGQVDVQIHRDGYTINQWVEEDESVWDLGTHKNIPALVKAIKKLSAK